MHPRFLVLVRALRGSDPWTRASRPAFRVRVSQFVCQSCQHKFSTSSVLRKAIEASSKAVQGAIKNRVPAAEQKYPSSLKIYDAGDMRTSFVSFWKATAMFQFGVVGVFLAPVLYHNENQPDPNIRLFHAVGIAILGATPMLLMSYLTSPFVKSISLQLPAYAQRSRDALMHFSTHLPSETRLEFTTLRAFPIRRKTAVFLFELRALPAQWWRFANIERGKTPAWKARQKEKTLWQRFLEVMNEPRFKFYVKEGRNYTIKTGVPGVWENVAKTIQMQSSVKRLGAEMAKKPVSQLITETKTKTVRRQTARPSR